MFLRYVARCSSIEKHTSKYTHECDKAEEEEPSEEITTLSKESIEYSSILNIKYIVNQSI